MLSISNSKKGGRKRRRGRQAGGLGKSQEQVGSPRAGAAPVFPQGPDGSHRSWWGRQPHRVEHSPIPMDAHPHCTVSLSPTFLHLGVFPSVPAATCSHVLHESEKTRQRV